MKKRISITIEEESLKKLNELSKQTKTNRSELIENIVENKLRKIMRFLK